MDRPYRLGVDIGGTFTDVILLGDSGRAWVGKTLTTTHDPSAGVETAVRDIFKRSGVRASEIRDVIHGTTLVTNAIIERSGAKTALLTTYGFRDTLEIARERRYDISDLFLEMPEPLVPRHLRFGVKERVLKGGEVETSPERRQIDEIAAGLEEQRVQAVAICFLHSYLYPDHERIVADWLRCRLDGVHLSLSCEVNPEIREYERTSTTVANAYVRQLIEAYLRRLATRLEGMGFAGDLYLMLSSGGICTVETACRFPIRLLESGPAAGALAAAYLGRAAGRPDLISFDMGGTTAKLGIIDGGTPLTTPDFEAARVYRFKRGSGLPIRARTIDLIEIGAGGGSVARVDTLGLLKVGPDSAGADPGPASYGRGGRRPTVTDADLVLGYLDPGFFLGGRVELDRETAFEVLEEALAQPLGLTTCEVAWGVHQVVNEAMASAAKVHAVERGRDPRAYALIAFGGAGPIHAYRVAELLGITTIVVPPGAGVASAFGLLCAPFSFDFVRSYREELVRVDWDRVNELHREMEEEGWGILTHSGVGPGEMRFERRCELRYSGQSHQLDVPVRSGRLGPEHVADLWGDFQEAYRRNYGRSLDDIGLEVIGWRLLASGPAPSPEIRALGARATLRSTGARKGYRQAFFPEYGAYRETPVFDRHLLPLGVEVAGPAIFEEEECTTVVGPGAVVSVDDIGNLVVEVSP